MNRKRERGFTIVELLVVITIIGMLMAMLMPAVGKVRSQVQRAQCINNQTQIAKAVVASASANGNMPKSLSRWPGEAQDPTNQKWHSWVVEMLPHMSRTDVYDRIMDVNNGKTRNPKYFLDELVCPSDQPANTDNIAPLSYVTNGGGWDVYGTVSATLPADWDANGSWSNNVCLATQPAVKVSLRYIADNDGTANTLLLGENVNAEQWMQNQINEEHVSMLWHFSTTLTLPFDVERDQAPSQARARPSSYHDGGFVVAFCDGSARFLSNDLEFMVYARLMSSNGRQTSKPNKANIGNITWQYDPVTEADLEL